MKFVLIVMTLVLSLLSFGCGQSVDKIANDVPAVEEAPFRDVTPAEAQTAIAKEKVQFIDVRDASEFQVRHAAKSVSVPLSDFDTRISELNPTTPTYVICEVGMRSKVGAAKLKKAGFTDVYHVSGGLQEWIKAGLPVDGEAKEKK